MSDHDPSASIEIDRLVRSRRKTVALIVERDGSLTVRAPLKASKREIQSLVQQKAGWIRAKQTLVLEKYPPLPAHRFEPEETFWYLGRTYPLEWADRSRPALTLEDGRFYLAQPAHHRAAEVFKDWYREEARRVVDERVNHYAGLWGLKYGRIRITSARTRWGSCSGRGTLSFPWRLVMAPLEVIDYVVVHELAHLEFKNHSKDFWTRVAAWMPEYRARKDWLKENGHLLALGDSTDGGKLPGSKQRKVRKN